MQPALVKLQNRQSLTAAEMTGAMEAIAGAEHIVPYLDMPFQHIADGVLRVDPASSAAKAAEGILKCRFLPWFDAAGLGDLFTLGGIARLQRHIFVQGK